MSQDCRDWFGGGGENGGMEGIAWVTNGLLGGAVMGGLFVVGAPNRKNELMKQATLVSTGMAKSEGI